MLQVQNPIMGTGLRYVRARRRSEPNYHGLLRESKLQKRRTEHLVILRFESLGKAE